MYFYVQDKWLTNKTKESLIIMICVLYGASLHMSAE